MGSVLLLLFSWLLTSTPRALTLSNQGGVYGGILAPRCSEIGDLTLRGEVGEPMELRCGSTLLGLFVVRAETKNGWDFDSVGWLAKHSAKVLGVSLLDARPAEEWRRWANDPELRARVRFDGKLTKNRKMFADYHQMSPSPPPTLVVEHHRLTAEYRVGSMLSGHTFELTGATLTIEARKIALRDLTRVGVEFFQDRPNSSHLQLFGHLVVVIGAELESLLTLTINADDNKNVELLHWMVQEIQAARSRVSSEVEGSTEDVPDELRQLTRPRTHEDR